MTDFYLLRALHLFFAQTSVWQRPLSAQLKDFFNKYRQMGANDRDILTGSVYSYIRRYNSWQLINREFKDDLAKVGASIELLVLYHALQNSSHSRLDKLQSLLTVEQQSLVAASLAKFKQLTLSQVDYELPPWLLAQLQQLLSADELTDYFYANVQPSTISIRVNSQKTRLQQLMQSLAKYGIKVEQLPLSKIGLSLTTEINLTRLKEYIDGQFEIQDEGSQLIALLCGVKKHQIVVDYCAGAGGKTLALAALLQGSGQVYAFDTVATRLQRLQPRLQRSSLTNVYSGLLTPGSALIKRLTNKADVVLVDAPCSGLGTLRRFPELKLRLQAQDIVEYSQLQQQILLDAAQLVKPGGRLIYATCSILPAENEEVAQRFSAQQGNFIPLGVQERLAQLKIASSADLCLNKGGVSYMQLWPQRHTTDGFFAALWQKKV